MIGDVMDYCKKHFIKNEISGDFVFDATAKTITGDFDTDDYVIGGYIYVLGSILNDTAYKLTAVSSTALTVDGTLYDENSTDKHTVKIFGLKPPRAFLSLAEDIKSWVDKYGAGAAGIASEKIDDYSVAFGAGVQNGGGWQAAFAGRLGEYRSLYNDLPVVQ